jgi:hypothetical protein
MQIFDFSKSHKELYTATPKVVEINVGSGTYLAVDGQGRPGGEAFQAAIQALYGTAYTIKFTCKLGGEFDFKVGKLECLYLSEPCKTPMDKWKWRFLLRVPDEVKAKHLAAARKTLKERKGADTERVKRIRYKEGRALQVLHVGPYDEVGATYELIGAYAREHRLSVQCPGHEIYISDPRRVAPARLKTIVRLPVQAAKRTRTRK